MYIKYLKNKMKLIRGKRLLTASQFFSFFFLMLLEFKKKDRLVGQTALMTKLRFMSPPRVVFKLTSDSVNTFMHPYFIKAMLIFLNDFILIDNCIRIFKQNFVFLTSILKKFYKITLFLSNLK